MPFEEEAARKKKLTSVVWETFTPLSSSGLRDGLVDSAKCSVCNKIFSTRHGTSSMMRHAKRHTELPNGAAMGKKAKKAATGAGSNSGAANSAGAGVNAAGAIVLGKKPLGGAKKDGAAGQVDEATGGACMSEFVGWTRR